MGTWVQNNQINAIEERVDWNEVGGSRVGENFDG